MTWERSACWRSGGKGRADGPADGLDGALELDPVGVDAGGGGGGADQGADGVVGQQVAPYFLLDHVRGLRAQHLRGPGRVRLDLAVRPLVLPALAVGPGERGGRGG